MLLAANIMDVGSLAFIPLCILGWIIITIQGSKDKPKEPPAGKP